MREDVKQQPLLYIDQKEESQPSAVMQTFFRSSYNEKTEKTEKDLENDNFSNKNVKKSKEENYFHKVLQREIPKVVKDKKNKKDEKVDVENKENEEKENEEKENEEIPFVNLSIKDKIHHILELKNREKHEIIETKDRDYIGKIIDYEEHHLYIEKENGEVVRLFIENIKDIKV